MLKIASGLAGFSLNIKIYILSVFFLFTIRQPYAQTISSRGLQDSIVYSLGCYQKFDAKKFIVPGVMIAYGFVARYSDPLFDLSESVQEETWDDHPHNTTTLDNYLQYAPAVAVYALNLAGIKGEHNFVDRSMIFLMSNLIMEGFVSTI